MPILSVFVTEKQKGFLELIIHGDAANSVGGKKGELGNSVQWCIDACMKIEERYGVDACYVGFHDIRLPENGPNMPNSEQELERSVASEAHNQGTEASNPTPQPRLLGEQKRKL